jgi:hypothetical protein
MLRLFVFLGAAAAAAAAGCSDTCTHPGVKVIELTVDDTIKDCSGYGPGLSTPATADECKQATLATKEVGAVEAVEEFTEGESDKINFDSCHVGQNGKLAFVRGTGTASKILVKGAEAEFGFNAVCKCSACPPPSSSSSSTGTGWTLLGIALGAGSAGGAIAYGAAQAP